jgi:PKHD-type hydroxylase
MDIVLEDFPNAESLKKETRKLTLIMALNQQDIDFEGGEIELIMGSVERPVKINLDKGKVIAFPSWMNYRIKPVTKGVRKFIAVWVEGPKFK